MRFHYDTSYADAIRLLRYPSDWLAYGLLVVALLAAPWILPRFLVGEIAYVFILCIGSLGLMILAGWTGQVSLGPAAFVAIGAYIHTLLLTAGLPFVVSIVVASLGAGLAGFVIGLPAIRVSGLYLAMVTLAFAIIVEHVIGRWRSVTGGFNGLPVPDPEILGWTLTGPRPFYYLCLAVLVIVFLALLNLTRGHVGRAFVGLRDSEAAAYALGVNVPAYKVLAFVVSSAVLGIAGALTAHHVQHLTPEGFGLLLSLEFVLMVVIGGLGSLRGAILGAILIGMLPYLVSQLKPFLPDRVSKQFGLEIFIHGLVLFVFVLFEPKGLNGRWLKIKALFTHFPLYRRDTFRRVKSYMKSERHR